MAWTIDQARYFRHGAKGVWAQTRATAGNKDARVWGRPCRTADGLPCLTLCFCRHNARIDDHDSLVTMCIAQSFPFCNVQATPEIDKLRRRHPKCDQSAVPPKT